MHAGNNRTSQTQKTFSYQQQKYIHTILDHQLQIIYLSKNQGWTSNENRSPELVLYRRERIFVV